MQRVLIFSSGTEDDGGSGFANLVVAERMGLLNYHIVGVVSTHEYGGVRKRADRLEVPFKHMTRFDAEEYQFLVQYFKADWVVLSGWMRMVVGLPAHVVINVHPAPLPRFGGPGCYGLRLFAEVLEAFKRDEISSSAICIHFAVPGEFDRKDTVVFRHRVEVLDGDTPEQLRKRSKFFEHIWYPLVLNLIVSGKVACSPDEPYQLTLPLGYNLHEMSRQFHLTQVPRAILAMML